MPFIYFSCVIAFLKLLIHCWVEMVGADIFVMFLILGRKVLVFQLSLCMYVIRGIFIDGLYQIEEILFFPLVCWVFLSRVLTFVNAFSTSMESSFFRHSVNMVYDIDWYHSIFCPQREAEKMDAMLIFPLILILFSQLTWNIERYSSERFFCLLEGTLTFYLLSYKISKICSVTVSEHIKRFLWLASLIRQRDLVLDVLFKKLKSKLDWSCLELHCKERKNSLQVLPKAQRAELESS